MASISSINYRETSLRQRNSRLQKQTGVIRPSMTHSGNHSPNRSRIRLKKNSRYSTHIYILEPKEIVIGLTIDKNELKKQLDVYRMIESRSHNLLYFPNVPLSNTAKTRLIMDRHRC
ncbi:hypothetical protein EDE11_11044 [Methylomonas methanica]|uniref:Uncharacterized protein n=1 Tax=Methylomonas methanica TaxID=421 RepID=A0ABY2CL66_METMH|nr:hypothetical protein EDE11_11044 [Methylomonas methanica]